nr:DUF3378 domain-containing protein [Exiguobacterium sp. SL14]
MLNPGKGGYLVGTTVLRLSKEKQDLVIEEFKQGQTKSPPYARFAAKVPGCVITIYNSGKVMFQGTQAEAIACTFWYGYTDEIKRTCCIHVTRWFC